MAAIGLKLYRELEGDKIIWLILFILSAFSLLIVYSATGSLAYKMRDGNTEYYLLMQGMYLIVSIGAAVFCYKVHYMNYMKWAPILFLVALIMLVYTMLFGADINDARRWIEIPIIGVTFQTSDFAKLALIIYIARAISNKQDVIKDFNSAFIPIIIPVILVCGLIAPSDLSTSLMLFATCVLMMFIGRVHIKYILLLLMMGLVLFAFLVMLGNFFPEMIRVDTWVARITGFFGDGDGYQVEQAKIAIANGGWFGEGPGSSTQRNFLPSPYADFIFAIICEEYGLVGGSAIVFIYLLLFMRCTGLVTKSPKAFGAILAIGLCLNLVIQAYLNIAVSVELVPVTGLTLPLVSMGGTSLLFTCVAFGIILSVSRHIDRMKEMELKMTAADAGNN